MEAENEELFPHIVSVPEEKMKTMEEKSLLTEVDIAAQNE